MFDWWDTSTSLVIVALLAAMRLIGQPLWTRYVGWHLRIRNHVWAMPLSAAAGLSTPIIALVFQQTRIAEVLFLLFFSLGLFFSLLVGARCPECGSRLQFRSSRYGPVKYRCRQCDYEWIGWPLRDPLPD
jgi:hypothetical protein